MTDRDVQARPFRPRSSHLDRVSHPSPATAAASRTSSTPPVFFVGFVSMHATNTCPISSPLLLPYSSKTRWAARGKREIGPSTVLCAGLFAHGVEKVHRKEADQQPSQHCRVVRKAGNPVATARQKGDGGRAYTVPKAKTLIRYCCNPRRRHDGEEVRREERGSLVSGPTGGKAERHGGCHA